MTAPRKPIDGGGLEERLRRPFIHGSIVGLGVYIMSRLQRNRPSEIIALMDSLGLAYQPADLGIPKHALVESLKNRRSYVQANDLWYTVIDEAHISDSVANELLEGLRFE